MKLPVLKSRRLILNSITEKDLPFFVEWLNDPEVIKHLSIVAELPLTMAKEKKWFRGLKDRKNDLVWAIRLKKNKELIGSIGFNSISQKEGTAEVGIAISNKKLWGRGFGPEAIRAILRYGFSKLKLNNVLIRTNADHKRAIKAYQKVGFKTFGIRRKVHYHPQEKKYRDQVYMDILKEDLK